ncbi:MAG: O-antigen ligase family protein [Xanthomonadaceae bacterium]|jgi:O-antigen ligase|nr:O-antigen ligase family protein [Xanthomonadaceae bacterium]
MHKGSFDQASSMGSLPPASQDRFNRQRIAASMCSLALWCLTAFATSLPKGLLPFAVLMLISTLLAPEVLYRHIRDIRVPLLLIVSVLVMASTVMLLSIRRFDLNLGAMENHARLLAIPWCMLWVYASAPSKTRLWQGAMLGIAATCALTVWQTMTGTVRASGWNKNAIVFADTLLMVIVIALFCTPRGRWPWTMAVTCLGALALVLTGTRSAWIGLLLVLCVFLLTGRWATPGKRVALTVLGLALAVTALTLIPGLNQRVRIVELKQDIARYEQGDIQSSSGLRLERLHVAAQAVAAHPLTGVGLGQFDKGAMVRALPECQDSQEERCGMGHAHNDLAEWAATMGIPGALALIAIYLAPFLIFIRQMRRIPETQRWRSAAMTGAMLVLVFAFCGMTQSMFAHQLTAVIYPATVGVVLGLALRESAASTVRIVRYPERHW